MKKLGQICLLHGTNQNPRHLNLRTALSTLSICSTRAPSPMTQSQLLKGCLYNLHSPILWHLHGISPSLPCFPAQTMSLSLFHKHQSSRILLRLPGEPLQEFLEPPPLPSSFHHGIPPQLPMDQMDPGPSIQPWGTPSRLAYLHQLEVYCLMDNKALVPLHKSHLEE